MKKLKLELDALAVESFRTSNEAGWRGTVNARSELVVAEGEVHAVPASADFSCTITTIPDTAYFSCTITTITAPQKTLPPAASCDTCYASCVTACSCRTMPCDTCA